MITLTITRSDLASRVPEIMAETDPNGPLGKVMGRGLANCLKAHFRQRNQTPNALGGARTNFWTAVGAAVQNPVQEPGAVTVAVSHPHLGHKLYGGTVLPTKRKWLAIPVTAAAHGHSPRVMTDLLYVKGGDNLLFDRPKSASSSPFETGGFLVRKESAGLRVLYVLKAGVTHRADPTALPTEAALLEAAAAAARSYLTD